MSNTLPPLIITSMNQRLYDEYGHRLFETWDRRYELIVYHEDYPDERPPYIPQWARHIHTPTVTPELYRWTESHRDRPTNSYKTDAVRFSHKVWAIWHAVITYVGWTTAYSGIIWMDADTTIKAMPTPQELVQYLDRADITVFDRWNCPETGIIWFSTRHKEINAWNSTYQNTGVEFVNRLREYYETDRIYQLKEQHDAYVTGHILKTEFKGAWASLSTHQATQNNHPQAQSPTAEWWDHCKGPRKKTGRSPENTA
jgi:hypothetical protein